MSNSKPLPGTGGDRYIPYAEREGAASTVYLSLIHIFVFIGPCYAKEAEALDTGCCDAVLLFNEVKNWMHEAGVVPPNRGIQTMRGGYRCLLYTSRCV